jgi:hypothetical protein
VVACGSRNDAFADFTIALRKYPAAINILVVDSEGPVSSSPWNHLRTRDKWDQPDGVTDDHCHLMVQAMEAWLIADPETLEIFYGQGFNPKPIPKTSDVETIEKKRLDSALREATRRSAKGFYHKTLHAPQLLERISVNLVRKKARHCNRLFETLAGMME